MNKYHEALIKLYDYAHNYLSEHGIDDSVIKEDVHLLDDLADKETPMKPPYERFFYEDGDVVLEIPTCYSCGRRIEIEFEEKYCYCPTCGQKLDWGDLDGNNR